MALPDSLPVKTLSSFLATPGNPFEDFAFALTRKLDVRAFAEGAMQGVEEIDTDALSRAWAEATSNAGDNALGADGGVGGITQTYINIPDGQLLYGGDPLNSSGATSRSAYSIIGQGQSSTRIKVTNGDYLIDEAAGVRTIELAEFQMTGSYKGAFRQKATGSLVGPTEAHKLFRNVVFADHTVCAIASNSINDPFYKIFGCRFDGAPGSKGVTLPPGGGHIIGWSWFKGGRIGLHLRGGRDTLLFKNRLAGGQALPYDRVDVWLEVMENESGKGLLLEANTLSNENDVASDFEYLFAAADTSTNPDHATAPDYGSYLPSTEIITDPGLTVMGPVFVNNMHSPDAGRTRGMIYSYTERVRQMRVSDHMSGAYPYIMHFDSGIAALSTGNRHAQTNVIEMLQEQGGQGVVSEPEACNLPGFGLVYDPKYAMQSDPSVFREFDADTLRASLSGAMSGLEVASGASISSAETDMASGADARTLTFSATSGAVRLPLSLGSAEEKTLCWLRTDLEQAGSNPLSEIQIQVGTAPNSFFFSRQIKVPANWRSLRWPVLLPTLSESLYVHVKPVGWVSGVSEQVRVARIRFDQT